MTARTPLELTTIAPGGIITVAAPDGTGYGSWAATGERSADATFLSPQQDPECGCLLGYGTIRTSIEVAEDGQSFTGTYTIEFPGAMAETMGLAAGQQVGPGTVTGQRITVDPMGEPVPFPEEAASPDAAASPEAGEAAAGTQARVIDLVATGQPRFTDPTGTQVTDIPVTPGETITFRVDNTAGFAHNFYIGTDEELAVFSGTTDSGIPNWESGVQELEWVVPEDVTGLKFGCTFPGHYKVMQGTFSVSA